MLLELPSDVQLPDAAYIEWIESDSPHDPERQAGSLARLTMRGAQGDHVLFGKLVRLDAPALIVSKRVVEQFPITVGMVLIFKDTKEDAEALLLTAQPLTGEVDEALRQMEVMKLEDKQICDPLYRYASCGSVNPSDIYIFERASDEEVTDDSDSEGHHSCIKRRHSA
jgi:hypothetical protein